MEYTAIKLTVQERDALVLLIHGWSNPDAAIEAADLPTELMDALLLKIASAPTVR